MRLFHVLLCLSVAALANAKFYSADIARERLVTDLFVNYNAASRPLPKGHRLDVEIHLEMQHFDFRETDGAFNFVGLLDVRWHDPKLLWDPKDYNNLTKISVSQKIVWVPDLEVYNNAPDKFLRMHRNGAVILEHTGEVLWTDVIEVTTFCTTNFRNWPHDRHECKLMLGSWTYDGLEIDFNNTEWNSSMCFAEIDTMNQQYQIVNFSAEYVSILYTCCNEPYINIDYKIVFERYASFVVIFRIVALSVFILTLLALSLETCRSEKIWLNGVSFIIIIFNLIYFSTKVGSFARKTPLIVEFFSWSLVLITLSHCVSIFSLMATRSRYQRRMPQKLLDFLNHSWVQVIAPVKLKKSKRDHTELNSQFEDVKLQEFSNLICNDFAPNEWTQLATVLERAMLIAYALIFLILTTIYYV